MKIGDIVLQSDLLTSDFGDKRLFFQHDRYWGDMKLNREKRWFSFQKRIKKTNDNMWLPDNETIALPDDDDAAREIIMEGIREHGCPFAWLLGLVDVE